MERETITVELVGPGMEKGTADPLVVLAFAAAYFKALARIAELRVGAKLELRGVDVQDKCIGVSSEGVAPQLRAAVKELDNALRDPFEREETVRALGRASRALPEQVRASVIIAGLEVLEIVAVGQYNESLTEIVDFRAYVHRVGGEPAAAEMLDSSDGTRVTLKGTKEQIKALSRHLYSIVDVTAEVETNQVTGKRSGKLIDFDPVPNVDPIAAWRKWFARNASEWNDIDDIESELDR